MTLARSDRLDLLADPAVRSAISRELGRRIEHHARIGSTQVRARSLADAGDADGIVVADEQSSGHGRQGRAWIAPRGTSLLASWIFRPLPADPALFSLLAGVAVARALGELGVESVRLKWPNDALLEGKKVAGVLADSATTATGGALVLGIGVNVHQTAAELADLAGQATSCAIEHHAVDRLALLARLTRQLDRIATSPAERAAALEVWRARASMLGRQVEVRSASGPVLRGLARELADDGALVLETSDGVTRVLAGEVSLTA